MLAASEPPRRRIAMAKGQVRSNREAKKPKKEKPKAGASTRSNVETSGTITRR
jgi:hypothetical protein